MIAQGVGTVKVERLDNPVPYKPEDSKLPKIDFEMAEFEPKNYFEKKEEALEQAAEKKHKSSSNENAKKGEIKDKDKHNNTKDKHNNTKTSKNHH